MKSLSRVARMLVLSVFPIDSVELTSLMETDVGLVNKGFNFANTNRRRDYS